MFCRCHRCCLGTGSKGKEAAARDGRALSSYGGRQEAAVMAAAGGGARSLTARLPVWDEQLWVLAGPAACRCAHRQDRSGRSPGELRHTGRGAGENLRTRLPAPRLRSNVLLYKYVQRDILHLPIRSIARCSKYPRALNSSGWGKIAKGRGWKGGKMGKSERKGQCVAFPSTPSTASPAPCSVCRDPAPPGWQSFLQGCLMLLTAAAKPQGSIPSQSPR